MTLGELVPALRKESSDRNVQELTALLEQWKSSSETTNDLCRSVERFIGNSWIENDKQHQAVYSLWSVFRDQCIAGRGGMTINERLYCFDLIDAWDNAKTEEEQAIVRHKIDFENSDKKP